MLDNLHLHAPCASTLPCCFCLLYIILQVSGVFSFSAHIILSSSLDWKDTNSSSDSLQPATFFRIVQISKQRSIMSSFLTDLTPQQLSSMPLQPPPNGVQSNFGDAENNNTPMYVVCSLFLAIMLCFFVNRIYTKIYIVRKFSWDDGKSRTYGIANGLI